MSAYYNEIDPFAAAWLRELIKGGHIADGEVDERSIELVRPDDLRGFDQCHFFAGIGGWSYALRLAGWPDDRHVWTGSCPCQPFSSAGAQAGGHDPRDLWPVWFELVAECLPVVVFGEQVEAAIGHGWLDRLCDDLEAEGYAIGACGLPAASVGAFHIRQRLWFVADTGRGERQRRSNEQRSVSADAPERNEEGVDDQRGGADGELADANRAGSSEQRSGGVLDRERQAQRHDLDGCGQVGELGHAGSARLAQQRGERRTPRGQDVADARETSIGAGAPVGFWHAAEWIPCADGKARPVEPGTFPLASGVSARVGRLRGYGNAIVPQVAAAFIQAYVDGVNP